MPRLRSTFLQNLFFLGLMIFMLCMTLLFLLLLTSCASTVPVQPAPTTTSVPSTVTALPLDTATAIPVAATVTRTPRPTAMLVPTRTPTLKPFDFSKLPGWLAYMDFDCSGTGLCTNVSIMRLDFSERHPITDHDHGLAMEIAWSPDGNTIAFTFAVLGDDAHIELRQVDLRTQKEVTLVSLPPQQEMKTFAWSPDSRAILYTVVDSTKNISQIMRVDLSS